MTDEAAPPPAWWRRPIVAATAALALLAYLPALTAAPGRMPADSKLYIYLDPGRFMGDAASTFDPRQFAGWVPHQHIAYLWPTGPWYWLFEQAGTPDWIAHRLWIGTLMLSAGLGVRWCARLLGLGQLAAFVAAVVYQVSPYVLPYVSRTSVMLLPWAGLGWIVGCTIRATRRRSWGDPAAIALLVFTVGAVNATALAMIVPAPLLWIVHTVWNRSITWRQSLAVAGRVVVLTIPVCVWWVAMLVIQGRFGAEVLPYSESLADVSLTSTAPEVWRSLGYWLFYVRDPYAATTTESLRYLSSSASIFISYIVPIVCLSGLVWVRWAHRRFAALLVAAGALLAVGVHPLDDRSPVMRLLAGDDEAGLALALRSSTRALPVMNLGLALLAGSLVAASAGLRVPRFTWRPQFVAAGVVCAVAIVNLPSLWNGAFVDPALERDQDPPQAWLDASSSLDARSTSGRVLQLPGAEFGAFRWGYTVDQPLPGLTDKPLVTRDLLPLGSPAAMDLLYALDDRVQDGVFEPASLAPVSRWLGVDTVWVTNDLAFDRFRTARPQELTEQVAGASGIGKPLHLGPVETNAPRVPMTDERSLAVPAATAPVATVDLYPVEPPGAVVRAEDQEVVVSGSGDGLVDLAAAGLLDGGELVRYSASLESGALDEALTDASRLLVTDSNRDRARQWRSSQDTTGFTESDQPELALLRDVASDATLPVFAARDEHVDPATQTLARQVGPVTATATSYGEPFAYLPERRPYMAIDGNPATAWTVGEHANPIGERIRLHLSQPLRSINVVQASTPGERRITAVTVSDPDSPALTQRIELTDESITSAGQPIDVPDGATTIDITIEAIGGGTAGAASAVSAVGFAELITQLPSTVEVVRLPTDALAAVDPSTPLSVVLTRLRVDPMDRWRSDPEPTLVREFELASDRTLAPTVEVRVDRRASDEALAAMFGWPVRASSRLTGSVANVGAAAIDGDDSTAWITAFGEALGATLTIDTSSLPIDHISLRQPVGEFSRITELIVRVGGDERYVYLTPEADGSTGSRIVPPLPAGTVEVVIGAIEQRTTLDRRYADVVELPSAISELVLPGLPAIQPLAGTSSTVECAPIVAVDGVEHGFSFALTVGQAIDGEAAVATPCTPSLELAAGAHRVESRHVGVPIQVDRVVLTDPGNATAPSLTPAAVDARVTDEGRRRRTIEVSGCTDGCWLVLGEGYNTAWSAETSDGTLGDPQLVDGGFNGWWIEPSDDPVQVVVSWTEQGPLHVAMAISVIGVIAAVVLLVLDRRRRRTETVDEQPDPEFITDIGVLSLRRAVLIAVTWTALSALLIAPEWALVAAVAGGVVVALRRRRIVELTAWATLVVVGALVTVRERRNAPAPNGGWPSVFESWHRLALFAVVSVLVASLFALDAQPVVRPVSEDDIPD